MRNNRIEEASRSNQGCANYWLLESKLRCDTLKIFFQQHRSTAVFKRCLRHVRYHPNGGAEADLRHFAFVPQADMAKAL